MAATRILLISQLLACLMVSVPACQLPFCSNFTGCNGCSYSGIVEPELPPRDNDCCGPHCTYDALNGAPGPCDGTTVRGRCILDTHCGNNVTFTFMEMTDCEFQGTNEQRLSEGFARFLSFNWTQQFCEDQNTKCGINCCCRETCPTLFCNTVTC